MAELSSSLARLVAFRAELYACCTRRRDALLELGDALLCAQAIPSVAHLSLEPAHRRGWGSAYAALARGGIDAEQVRDLLVRHPLDEGLPIFAVDATCWARCDANCSPQRGLYYHPSRHSAGQPIVAGWAFQWIAQLSFTRDSWTAPLDARRLHPHDNHNQVAVAQIRELLDRLPTSGQVPLFVFDAGYDPTGLVLGLAEAPAAILVRLRSGRCFYADPPPRVPTVKGGRPRRHGAKLDTGNPATWPAPTASHTEDDHQYGRVHLQAWAGLHPKQQLHATRGTKQPRPIVRGTLVRLQVERVPANTRPPQVLWLWWHGPGTPELAMLWRAYVRRFDLEHTIRFCKQTLGWTTPRPRHPEQADRWTWLVLAAYTQLRLARCVVSDRRLPWERPRPAGRLTPGRVRRGFPQLLAQLGSPASAPKPCGRSPGRPRGSRSGPAARHPTIKKAA
jgi:DDE superfamily endonuclease